VRPMHLFDPYRDHDYYFELLSQPPQEAALGEDELGEKFLYPVYRRHQELTFGNSWRRIAIALIHFDASDARNVEDRIALCSDSNCLMNKGTARNVLLALGTWSVSGILAWLFSLLIPVGGITFRGDLGNALLWVWLGFPHLLAAMIAAITLVWVTDTRRPLAWLFGLAGLFLYSESMHAWRQFRRPWHEPPRLSDYVGIAIATMIPTLTCLVIGIWWRKRLAGKNSPTA